MSEAALWRYRMPVTVTIITISHFIVAITYTDAINCGKNRYSSHFSTTVTNIHFQNFCLQFTETAGKYTYCKSQSLVILTDPLWQKMEKMYFFFFALDSSTDVAKVLCKFDISSSYRKNFLIVDFCKINYSIFNYKPKTFIKRKLKQNSTLCFLRKLR